MITTISSSRNNKSNNNCKHNYNNRTVRRHSAPSLLSTVYTATAQCAKKTVISHKNITRNNNINNNTKVLKAHCCATRRSVDVKLFP